MHQLRSEYADVETINKLMNLKEIQVPDLAAKIESWHPRLLK